MNHCQFLFGDITNNFFILNSRGLHMSIDLTFSKISVAKFIKLWMYQRGIEDINKPRHFY